MGFITFNDVDMVLNQQAKVYLVSNEKTSHRILNTDESSRSSTSKLYVSDDRAGALNVS